MRLWPFGRKNEPARSPIRYSQEGGVLSLFIQEDEIPEVNALISNVVMIPVLYILASMLRGQLVSQAQLSNGVRRDIPDDPLLRLLSVPNANYSGTDLLSGTLIDYLTAGNA